MMNKKGPIIIIEDDEDDREFMNQVFKKLNYENEIIFFWNGALALEYLNATTVSPFIIICDINMPLLNGFQLKDRIEKSEALHLKCIPYLYLTTASTKKMIIEAYSKSVQGFFIKPGSMEELEKTIRVIVEYWKICEAPNP